MGRSSPDSWINSSKWLTRKPNGPALHAFQYTVVCGVQALGLNSYCASLQEYIARATDKEVPAAQVFVTLRRLEDKGFVTSHSSRTNSSADRKGRLRRSYALTAPGLQALEQGRAYYARLYSLDRNKGEPLYGSPAAG